MEPQQFFDLLLIEIAQNPDLRKYYKFLDAKNQSVFNFRKNYFLQRLNYIHKSIKKDAAQIWDCGCGFGTTAIFLTLNGHNVYANTLEFYYEQIPKRLKYWENYGNLNSLNIEYLDLFDISTKKLFNYIIVQDTFHHLEPIDKALAIISNSLQQDGEIIAIEENGNNIFNRFKNYIKRGNNRIIEIYDEKTKKYFTMGNENTRPLKLWISIFKNNGLKINTETIDFTRLFLPLFYYFMSNEKLVKAESKIWKKIRLLRNYFYFGINFTATKI